MVAAQKRDGTPAQLVVVVVVLACCLIRTECFMPQRRPISSSFQCSFSKLPEFDLAALEAYEAQLAFEDLAADDDTGVWNEDENTLLEDAAVESFVVTAELHGKRIDGALTTLLDQTSRTACGNLVTSGCVAVRHADQAKETITRKAYKLEAGQTIEVTFLTGNGAQPDSITAQNIPLDVLFEDEHMIVLNKAPGMVVHPAVGNWDGTVVNALAHYLPQVSRFDHMPHAFEKNNLRPGIVHRLDKGTSGVLVVAKTPHVVAALSEQFANRSVKKTYLAITIGNPGKNALIDKPIGRHPVHRQRMRVAEEGRRAVTLVDNISFDGKLGFTRVQIATGRTHQIRVHLTDRHTPILGDDVYGLRDWNDRYAKRHNVDRPLLHAYRLRINHPITNEPLVFEAPMPSDMETMATLIDPDAVMPREEQQSDV
jgi:23S rRNA pseudouridine1911/1915/1917 synthase